MLSFLLLLFCNTSQAQNYPPPTVQYRLPNPTTAAILSAEIGFGTGHFYSQRPIAGTTHLVIQAGSLSVAAYGLISLVSDINSNINTWEISAPIVLNEAGEAEASLAINRQGTHDTSLDVNLLVAGIAGYMIDHVVDTITAPVSAKKTGMEMLKTSKFEKRLERKGLR